MSPDPEAIARAKQILERLWEQHKGTILERVSALEIAAASAPHLDVAARQEARSAAHKLAGSLGTFGYNDASDWARESEQILEKEQIDTADQQRLVANAQKIRNLLATPRSRS